MKVSLSRAAKLTGKSKSSISYAIKTGRLSADRGEGGIFEIDMSELQRVFVLVDQHARRVNVASKASTTLPSIRTTERPSMDSPDIVDLQIEIARLTERLEARDDKINDMSKTLEELRYERDDYRERFLEADQKLIGVLNNQPSAPTNHVHATEHPVYGATERVDVGVNVDTVTSITPSAKHTDTKSVRNPLMLSKLWRVFGKD